MNRAAGILSRRMETEHRHHQPNLDALRCCTSRCLCVSRDNTLPGVVLPYGAGRQFGPGCLSQEWPTGLLYTFPPLLLIAQAPPWGLSWQLLAGSSVTGRLADLASKPRCLVSMGLASAEPVSKRIDESDQDTLYNTRALSTRACYALKWRKFLDWCASMGLMLAVWPVPHVLRFLRSQGSQYDKSLCFSLSPGRIQRSPW